MPERLEQQPAGRTLKVSEFVLAGAVPLVAYALNRRRGGGSAGLSVAGSVSLLAGAWLFRHSLLKIGMESARDPQAQFAFAQPRRSEEHTSELQSLMRISYAVFCLKKKKY